MRLAVPASILRLNIGGIGAKGESKRERKSEDQVEGNMHAVACRSF